MGRIFQAFIFWPENVEICFVALHEVFVAEELEAVSFFAFESIFGMVTSEEFVFSVKCWFVRKS
jgi:hypothetical protein